MAIHQHLQKNNKAVSQRRILGVDMSKYMHIIQVKKGSGLKENSGIVAVWHIVSNIGGINVQNPTL